MYFKFTRLVFGDTIMRSHGISDQIILACQELVNLNQGSNSEASMHDGFFKVCLKFYHRCCGVYLSKNTKGKNVSVLDKKYAK